MNFIRRFAGLSLLAISVSFSAQAQKYRDVNAPIEERVNDALSQMTLKEKVNLCHATAKFYSPGVPRLGIPGIWTSDGPHGVRMEMAAQSWDYAHWAQDSCTAFPSLTCLAATWNPEMSARYGHAIGEEARYRGKTVLLGPGVNIARTPLNGRNFEYMGEDPHLSSIMCVPYIKEVQKQGVATCVKHYCLNNQEWQRWTISSECDERTMREIYLPAFHAAIKEGGSWSIMGAYNKVNGTHACHNDFTLNKILKQEWGFDGVVMSDWDGTHNTREAALNGLDIEMGTSNRRDKGINHNRFTFDESYLGNDYYTLLSKGELPMSSVDDKARRILRLIFRTAMDGKPMYGNQDYAAHSVVCREIGGEGIVMLRNEAVRGGRLLPIQADKYRKILVVGDNATRKLTVLGGSSELKAQHETSPLAALKALYGDKIMYAHGYDAGKTYYDHEEVIPAAITDSLRKEAVDMARQADLVIFVGGLNKSKHQDCEDADRRSYDLPYGQNELLRELSATNPNIISVFMGGTPARIPGFDKKDRFASPLPALLWGWYLGSDAGDALCDVLTGKVNPSGKLPVTFPAHLEDTPAAHYGEVAYPGKDGRVEYKEGVLVGYRWYDTKAIKPLFAFGHGLSYTQFAYSNLRISSNTISEGGSITVSLDVKNTGKVDGKETVQLYVGDDKCSVIRPVKELKRFDKQMIKTGSTATYQFTITADDLKFYSEQKHDWTAEPGTFTIYVGSSSADIRLKGKVSFK